MSEFQADVSAILAAARVADVVGTDVSGAKADGFAPHLTRAVPGAAAVFAVAPTVADILDRNARWGSGARLYGDRLRESAQHYQAQDDAMSATYAQYN